MPPNCDPNFMIFSSDKTQCYILKLPKNIRTIPKLLPLDIILGVHTGGPSGRRKDDEGHSIPDYLEFIDLIRYIYRVY